MTPSRTSRRPRDTRPSAGTAVPWGAAVTSALASAAVPLALLAVTTLALWALTPGVEHDHWAGAVRGAARLWLLAHGVPADTPSGVVGVPAWGLGVVPVWFLWRSGRRLRAALADRRALFAPPAAAGWAVCLGSYAAIGAVVAVCAGSGGRAVVAAVATGLVAAAAVAAGIWTGNRDGAGSGPDRLREFVAGRWSDGRAAWLDAVVRGVAACLVALAGLAALAVVTAVLVGLPGIVRLYGVLGGGAVGIVALTLLQLAWLPTYVVWALGWIAGPGFAVGAGSSFTPGATVAGALPAFPVLGALPDVHGGIWPVVVVLPVLVGLVAGAWLRRRGPWSEADEDSSALLPGRPRWVDDVALAAAIGLGCGLVVALAGLLTSGPIGPGRMATTGVAGSAPVLLGLEVFAGAGIALAAVPPLVRGLGRAERRGLDAVAGYTEPARDRARDLADRLRFWR